MIEIEEKCEQLTISNIELQKMILYQQSKLDLAIEGLKFYNARSNVPVKELCMAFVDAGSTYECLESYTSLARETLKKLGV